MKTQRLSSDRISTLPATIIENILCLVPIQEAARTSILSREWRYTWTKIPKLVFDDKNFEVSSDESQLSIVEKIFNVARPSERNDMTKRCKLFSAILQVLLLHQGPITDFTLFMKKYNTRVGIDQIILHLTRKNTLKKLQLRNMPIPLHVFSLHQLTDLYLHKCFFGHKPTFNGFGSLTTLYMEDVKISKKTLLHLLSNCPLLKNLSLLPNYHIISNDDDSGLIELFGSLRVIEHLTIGLWGIECFGVGVHPSELPTSLVHLKYICLHEMIVIRDDTFALPFLVLLIKSSPNLEKLKLWMITSWSEFSGIEDSYTPGDYSGIWLEHLIELEIDNLSNSKADLDFVKLLLAKSPVLKKLMIFLNNKITSDEELEIPRLFLNYPHASAEVEIVVQRCG